MSCTAPAYSHDKNVTGFFNYMKAILSAKSMSAAFWLEGGSLSLKRETAFPPVMKLGNFALICNIQTEQ